MVSPRKLSTLARSSTAGDAVADGFRASALGCVAAPAGTPLAAAARAFAPAAADAAADRGAAGLAAPLGDAAACSGRRRILRRRPGQVLRPCSRAKNHQRERERRRARPTGGHGDARRALFGCLDERIVDATVRPAPRHGSHGRSNYHLRDACNTPVRFWLRRARG